MSDAANKIVEAAAQAMLADPERKPGRDPAVVMMDANDMARRALVAGLKAVVVDGSIVDAMSRAHRESALRAPHGDANMRVALVVLMRAIADV